jgi:hypothetical protein
MKSNLIKISAGEYETQDRMYRIFQNGNVWEIVTRNINSTAFNRHVVTLNSLADCRNYLS